MDRTHLSFQAMEADFNEIFESTLESGYLSACPFCLHHVMEVRTLHDHFREAAQYAFVEHMNERRA